MLLGLGPALLTSLASAAQLLRLKCVAYSTLNDADEDADAETRLRERMEARGAHNAPKPSDVSPAALYLTAILEYVSPSSGLSVCSCSRE